MAFPGGHPFGCGGATLGAAAGAGLAAAAAGATGFAGGGVTGLAAGMCGGGVAGLATAAGGGEGDATIGLVGAGSDETLSINIRLLDHQVHVQRQFRRLAKGCDHVRAERDVRHEMPVHHITVQPVAAGLFDALGLVREMAEIAGQN